MRPASRGPASSTRQRSICIECYARALGDASGKFRRSGSCLYLHPIRTLRLPARWMVASLVLFTRPGRPGARSLSAQYVHRYEVGLSEGWCADSATMRASALVLPLAARCLRMGPPRSGGPTRNPHALVPRPAQAACRPESGGICPKWARYLLRQPCKARYREVFGIYAESMFSATL